VVETVNEDAVEVVPWLEEVFDSIFLETDKADYV